MLFVFFDSLYHFSVVITGDIITLITNYRFLLLFPFFEGDLLIIWGIFVCEDLSYSQEKEMEFLQWHLTLVSNLNSFLCQNLAFVGSQRWKDGEGCL